MHINVEVPEPVTLVGLRAHVMPVAGEVVAVRLTTPLKPFTAVIVIVDVAGVLRIALTEVGLAAIVKSLTMNVTVVLAVVVPLVPVTVTA